MKVLNPIKINVSLSDQEHFFSPFFFPLGFLFVLNLLGGNWMVYVNQHKTFDYWSLRKCLVSQGPLNLQENSFASLLETDN